MIIEDDLNKLNKMLTTEQQRILLKKIKGQFAKQEKYNHKLDLFFMRSLDGSSPESLKEELGL